MDPRLAKVLRFTAAFAANLLLAVIGSAILDRLQQQFHFWQWHRWILLRSFWLSFVTAGGLGFLVEHFWKTGAGKWIFIATTSLFGLSVFVYAAHSYGLSSVPISGLWWHFAGTNCMATRQFRDCRDFLIFSTTFVRGFGYSAGAMVKEMVRKAKGQKIARNAGKAAISN